MDNKLNNCKFATNKLDKMKAADLRVGNIFSHHSREGYLGDIALKAESILLAEKDISVFNETHCPYKITEKWIEKAGFAFFDYLPSIFDAEIIFKEYKRDISEVCYYVVTDNGDGKFSFSIQRTGDDEYMLRDIKYVHEFQNLFFAISGEELL